MWWASLREKLRKMPCPSPVQEKRSPLLLMTQVYVPHQRFNLPSSTWIVRRANGQLLPANWGDSWEVLKTIYEKTEGALLCQSSPERWCRTMNSLSFWCLGSISQRSYLNHSLWTPKAFQVYRECLKRSISRCRDFHDPDSYYMQGERRQPLPPHLKVVSLHHLHLRRHAS